MKWPFWNFQGFVKTVCLPESVLEHCSVLRSLFHLPICQKILCCIEKLNSINPSLENRNHQIMRLQFYINEPRIYGSIQINQFFESSRQDYAQFHFLLD